MKTLVSSPAREVVIADGQPTVLIGERLNPAGKKSLIEALKKQDAEFIRQEARAQVAAGADILDINVGVFGLDEAALLPEIVKIVTATTDVPLCLDSHNAAALEAALKICPGHPLVNSVTGEEGSLSRVLPLVKEHDCPVVALVQDGNGLPGSAAQRVAVAAKIIERAEKAGIPREKIIVDPLAGAVGADPGAVQVALETIRRLKTDFGVNITLGASNVSFGMPERGLINSVFISMAIAAGATCLIVDVARVRQTILAADLLLGYDKHARRFISDFRKRTLPGTLPKQPDH
jgi:5-methyltetrahydrofolate--homocysteine methyltransferase